MHILFVNILTCLLNRHSDKFYKVLASPILTPLPVNVKLSSPNKHSNSPNQLSTPPTINLYSISAKSNPAENSMNVTALSLLINCCSDEDPSTRKFACFAVGNAAFHNNTLYSQLSSSVVLLLRCLDDADDKTRANAAGAIGNLVRNAVSNDVANSDSASKGKVTQNDNYSPVPSSYGNSNVNTAVGTPQTDRVSLPGNDSPSNINYATPNILRGTNNRISRGFNDMALYDIISQENVIEKLMNLIYYDPDIATKVRVHVIFK